MKKVLKAIGIILLLVALVAVTVVAYLTVDEYRPGEVENLEIAGEATSQMAKGKSIRVMSWNLGYGALGDNADFFMDGGKMVYTADEERVKKNLDDIAAEVDKIAPDILIAQETDLSEARSYFINEPQYLMEHSSAAEIILLPTTLRLVLFRFQCLLSARSTADLWHLVSSG